MIQIYHGDGKGKTTAAVDWLCARWGADFLYCLYSF